MGVLQSLFAAHGPDYLERFGESMPAGERKALRAAMACRTPAAGLMVCTCDACTTRTLLPRSCGNRHCPTCQGAKQLAWLARQLERALPTHHFLLTFTVPESMRGFLRAHPKGGYDALFAASAWAIRRAAARPRYKLGDRCGFFGVLHT